MTLTNSTLLISGKIAPSQIAGVSLINTPVTVTGVIERAPGSTVPVTLTSGSGDWIIKGANINATFNSPDGTGLLVVPSPGDDASFENVEINVPLTIQPGAILRGSPTLNGRLKNAGTIIMPQFSGGTLNLAAGSENTGTILLERSTPTFRGAGLRNDGAIRLTKDARLDFQGGTLSGTGLVEVEAGSVLTLAEGGRQNRLALAGFARLGSQFASGGRLTLKELSIAGTPGAWTGKLDLGGGALAIDYDPQNGSPLAMVVDQLKTARGPAGAWNGPGGITSTRAASSTTSTVGYAEAADVLGLSGNQTATWRGEQVDASTLLVGYVKRGDANLDGKVAFEDLVALAQNYDGPAGAGVWWHGDFNYDSNVNFADLVVLAQNYGAVASAPVDGFNPAFASDVERAFAAVPEPAILGPAATVGLLLAPRARRRATRGTGLCA
jgi:hypothetical protein